MKASLTEELIEESLINVDQRKSIERGNIKKSLWTKIAKNEIRVRTSSFRNHRALFFVSLYLILSVWAFVLAPALFDLFMPQIALAEEFSDVIVIALGAIIESLMMIFFLFLLMYPLNIVYRKVEIGFKETLLASPASASDIFLGEFMGKMPIYTAAVLLITPIIIGLINPLINLTFIQYLAIYGCVFGLVFFANLIGSVIASWIEHKISQNEKARDLGKALIIILTIIMIIIMYAMMLFLNFLMENPGLRNWLNLYPSLWYSNIVLYMLEPSLIDAYILNVYTSSILAICVPLVVLYICYKKAGAFYSLEGGIEKISSVIKHENLFYKFARRITGRKWSGLVATQLKGFLRKRENIARVAFVVGFSGFMGWMLTRTLNEIGDSIFVMIFLIIMAGAMFSVMLGNLVFIESKDLIWVYKRSPRGVNGLVYSYMLAMLVFNIIITIGLTILFSILVNLDFINAFSFFIIALIYNQLSLSQAIAIQCMNPAFEVKGGTMQGNALISMMTQNIPLFVLVFGIIGLEVAFDISITSELSKIIIFSGLFLISGGITIPLFYYGMKKLNRME